MKKRIIALIMVLTLTLAFTAAYGEQAKNNSGKTQIAVTGTASVTLKADFARVELGVSNTDKSMTVAQENNAKLMNEVIEKLTSLGIGQEDMHTSNFYVSPKYDYDYGKLADNEALIGYTVENTLSVTIRDLENISKILDGAISAGANRSYGLTFQSDKTQEAYLDALKQAVKDGLEKAVVLSESIGGTLGTVLSIEEGGSSGGGTYKMAYAMADEASTQTPVIANDIVVSASVKIVYEMN